MVAGKKLFGNLVPPVYVDLFATESGLLFNGATSMICGTTGPYWPSSGLKTMVDIGVGVGETVGLGVTVTGLGVCVTGAGVAVPMLTTFCPYGARAVFRNESTSGESVEAALGVATAMNGTFGVLTAPQAVKKITNAINNFFISAS